MCGFLYKKIKGVLYSSVNLESGKSNMFLPPTFRYIIRSARNGRIHRFCFYQFLGSAKFSTLSVIFDNFEKISVCRVISFFFHFQNVSVFLSVCLKLLFFYQFEFYQLVGQFQKVISLTSSVFHKKCKFILPVLKIDLLTK